MANHHRRRVLQHLLRGLMATQEQQAPWGQPQLWLALVMHYRHHRQEHWRSSLRSLTPLVLGQLSLLSSSVPTQEERHCSNQVEVA